VTCFELVTKRQLYCNTSLVTNTSRPPCVCVCVCVCAYQECCPNTKGFHLYVYTYVYIHACIHTYMHAYIHSYTHAYTYIHTYIHYIFIDSTNMCVRVCVCVCICAHTHKNTYMYLCTRTHTHTHTKKGLFAGWGSIRNADTSVLTRH
jgi:hypothetical protein